MFWVQSSSSSSSSSGSALFELAKVTVVKSQLKYIGVVRLSLIPNSATDIHQQGPNNVCSHATKLTTPMYFN
jgi:hypothetical protein